MKLVVDNLGKVLIVVFVAALIFSFIAFGLLPGVRSFVSTVFLTETNYVEKSNLPAAPILKSDNDVVYLSVGENDGDNIIFKGITAQSRSGQDLIPQLKDDFDKAISNRSHVFVYQINLDNTNTLVSSIDTSSAGKWAVFYLVEDGSENAFLKVSYVVS